MAEPVRTEGATTRGVDPSSWALAMSARMVAGASAGVALHRSGPRPLPGLASDPLLATGSAVTELSCAYLAQGQVFTSFLWPRCGAGAPDDLVRLAVIGRQAEMSEDVRGAVVLARPGDVRGLTPRELEVLGLVMEGLSNQQIAHRLVVAARTVATHLEHILVKLDAPTRTCAAVRAGRLGLFVPPWRGARRNRG